MLGRKSSSCINLLFLTAVTVLSTRKRAAIFVHFPKARMRHIKTNKGKKADMKMELKGGI
jgi:hypothetical protein